MPDLVPLHLWPLGFVTYFLFHLLHVVCWRAWPHRRTLKELLFLLCIAPSFFYLVGIFFLPSALEGVAPWLVHLLLAMNYIAIYPAFQASSPTIHLLCALRSEPQGIARETLLSRFATNHVVEERFQDLCRSRLILIGEEGLSLSRFGSRLAQFFIYYRRCLGLSEGGG